MTRVNLLCEDRTGTGLARVIESAAQAARAAAGRAPLRFPRNTGTIASNTKLIEQCAKYPSYRFRGQPCYEHVFYVIDAFNLWDLRWLKVPAPEKNDDLDEYLAKLAAKAHKVMEQHARGHGYGDDAWSGISGGFHTHLLVWERESLMLPVSRELKLGEPPDDPRSVRHPAKWVARRYRELHKRKYEKSVQGPVLLGQIASSAGLRERVLQATPSLAEIVDALAALP